MQRVIDVYLEGDLTRLLERWVLPEAVVFRQESPDVATALLVDDDVERFDELEAVVAGLSGVVRLEATFWAHSFEEDERRAATLLALRAPRQHDLVLRRTYGGGAWGLSGMPRSAVVVTDEGDHVFERPLLGWLERRGLTAGLAEPIPLRWEGQGPSDEQWQVVTAALDLGPALPERRFVRRFRREGPLGVHFATSSAEGGRSLYVSQDVYRALAGLGAAVEGVTFEPVELVGPCRG